MVEVRLTPDEAVTLQRVLQALVIRERTSELGIIHGAERFVGTQMSFKRRDLELLDSVARKVGFASGLKRAPR